MATEVAEDAFLEDRLHLSDAIGRQVIGLVKRDLAVVDLAENAVEHDEVVMRVDVGRRAKAREEVTAPSWARDGAPGLERRSVARIARRRRPSTSGGENWTDES